MVPILYVIGPHAGSRAPNHPHHMVLCHVGHGPLRTLQKMPGDFTHLLVVVNKFSKWIKANPMDTIGSKQAVSFVQDIVFHFAVPNSIITDNDTQFTGEKFLNFCEDNNIRVDWAAVAQLPHKRAGQACKWYDTTRPKVTHPHPRGPRYFYLTQDQSHEVGR
jgi:hypothetical protein